MVNLENSALAQMLGMEGIAELRSKLIEMIVEESREQLQQSFYYIISPDDISESIYDDVITKVIDEIKYEYRQMIKDAVDKKVKEMFV